MVPRPGLVPLMVCFLQNVWAACSVPAAWKVGGMHDCFVAFSAVFSAFKTFKTLVLVITLEGRDFTFGTVLVKSQVSLI